MGEVVKLPRERKRSLGGAARDMVSSAVKELKEPSAIVIVALSRDGSFALRSVSDAHWHDFDINNRAIAIIEADNRDLMRFTE